VGEGLISSKTEGDKHDQIECSRHELLVLAWLRGWLKRPGALTGAFLVCYGLSRSFVEFFRQPDMQFGTDMNPFGHALHFGSWGLTMGQVLSLPMIVIGLTLMWCTFRRSKGASESDLNVIR